MRIGNRILEDPTPTPNRTRRASSPRGSTTRASFSSPTPARCTSPGPFFDFLPDRGTRPRCAEVAAFYGQIRSRRSRHAQPGLPTSAGSRPSTRRRLRFPRSCIRPTGARGPRRGEHLPPEALWCTPSGQVREDLGGRSLMEVMRDEARVRRSPPRTIGELYHGPGYPACATGRSSRSHGAPGRDRLGGVGSDRLSTRSSTATVCTTAGAS